MTTAIHRGSFDRPAMRRWRDAAGALRRDRLARPGRDRVLGRGRDLRAGAAVAAAATSAAARCSRRSSAAHWLGTDYLGPRHAGARDRRRALHRRRRLRRHAAGQRHRHAAGAAGRGQRPLDRLHAQPRAGHADRDPEQDVRAGDRRRLRLVGADADRHRGDHLRAGLLPHRALAGGQHQRARLRDGGAHARRRHRLHDAARDPAQHHRADAGRPGPALRLRRAAARQL